MDRKDLIRKSDAIEAIEEAFDAGDCYCDRYGIRGAINLIPAVEPWELYNPDEWCRDCKEYDTENHRCPRWNRVIRRTLEESQPKQGEWLYWNYKCSCCGKALMDYFIYTEDGDIIEAPNFCPNCGAKMQSTDGNSDSENAKYSSQDCPWK